MDGGDGENLLDFWLMLYRRRWVVYLAVTAVVLATLIGSFLVTPLYRATATLQIQRHSPDVLNMTDLGQVDYSWAAYSDFYQTQYKIIGSNEVARRAVETLGLTHHPGFDPQKNKPGLVARLRSLLPRKTGSRQRDPVDIAAGRVRGGLEVSPIRNSQLVRVSWISDDPDLAAQIAGAVADAYISLTIESRYSTTDQARQFLVDQTGELKSEIQAIEERLQTYGESKGILSIDDASNLTLQALKNIAEERTRAQTTLARAEARYRAVADTPAEGLPEVMESTLISRLRAEHAAYEVELSEKAKLFKEDWPELQTLTGKLTQARERLEIETQLIATQVVAAAASEYANARKAFDNLDALLEGHETDAQRLERDAVEYANLQSEAEKRRDTLTALLQRKNEMTLSSRLKDLDATSSNIRIMEPARAPAVPFRPRTKLNLLLGAVFGLVLGVGMAFTLDYFDNTFTSVSELERVVSIPVLAAIPRHNPKPTSVSGALRQRRATVLPFDLIPELDGAANAAEAYRDLRTAILLSHAGQPPRLIMITSALPGEGKTASALNLAVVMAHLGRRILLVDTDLRCPRIHSALGVPNDRGVTTYLTGLHKELFDLVQPTGVEQLDVLPSGPIPPNPSELLNSEIFAALGPKALEHGYDHVVFDSPPVLAVSDAVLVADVVEFGILVVRAGSTPRQSAATAADKLKQARHGQAGAVLNGVSWEGPGYYRYQHSRRYEPNTRSGRQGAEPRAGGAARS